MRLTWPNLTWRQSAWPAGHYRAKSKDGSWSYVLTHEGAMWRLTTWHHGIHKGRRTAKNAAELQQIADNHAAANA